jgi:hypothetical protein
VSQETETSKIQVLSETQLRNLLEELGVGETVSRADSRSSNKIIKVITFKLEIQILFFYLKRFIRIMTKR